MTDLISRSAVLALAYCAIKPTQDCPSVKSVVDVEDIERLPAIDAVPVVHAGWAGVMWCYRCTNCGAYGPDDGGHKTKFCPDCGARMDGENEGEG